MFSERFPTVNWVDLILLCVFALFGLRGFFRGFFREVFSLVALVAGFMVAVAYDQEIATFVSRHWKMSPLLLKGLSFVAIFFVVYFLLNLAGWLLHRSEKLLFLKTLNRTGGVALGLGKGAALAAMGIFLLSIDGPASPADAGQRREFLSSRAAHPARPGSYSSSARKKFLPAMSSNRAHLRGPLDYSLWK